MSVIRKGRLKQGPMLLGVDLRDAREEVFVRMVCDGLSMGLAFSRAGFTSKHKEAAANLFHLPRVQERAQAILEARRSTGVVTLAEVTDMLKRVFAGAHSAEEFSAAHNAAFSLARLYGHVTDKATLEVIRRPSRDPDAPSEQALASWVEALPALPAPSPLAQGPGPGLTFGPVALEPSPVALELEKSAFSRVPAAPLARALEPGLDKPSNINDLAGLEPSSLRAPSAGLEPRERENLNEINWLGPEARARPENGAPTAAVTVALQPRARATPLGRARATPLGRAHATPLGKGGGGSTPIKKKRVPPPARQVPGYPKAEDLF